MPRHQTHCNVSAPPIRHPHVCGQTACGVRETTLPRASQTRAHIWFSAALGMGAPCTAVAHGEEVLVSVFAEGLVLILVIAVSAFWSARLSRKLFTMAGALVGTVAAWVTTAEIPYRSHALFITIIHVLLPLIGAALCVGVTMLAARRKAREFQRSQRQPKQ
jgi:uncharacterized membrane protein